MYAIEEELHVLDSGTVDKQVKFLDESICKAATDLSSKKPRGTDVHVLFPTSSGDKKMVLGLLDSGATSNFVKREILSDVPHSIKSVNDNVKGRYNSTVVKEQATFELRLPDFASSKSVTVTALVEDSATVVGRHGIIFGSTFLHDLGITFDYARGTIIWDDVATSMKTIPHVEANSINVDDIDPADKDLPVFMQKAASKAHTIKLNIYNKYN